MSRCNYTYDLEPWALIRWRGAVQSSIKGKRGQTFLREMLGALDSLPEKRLIAGELVTSSGKVCAIGSVMLKRNENTANIDVEDYESIAKIMGISEALVREIEYINDEVGVFTSNPQDAEESRFRIVRGWIIRNIAESEAEITKPGELTDKRRLGKIRKAG